MHYSFPRISHIDDIEGFRSQGLIHEAFRNWTRDNGTIVYDYNYMGNDVFPPIGANDFARFARELRGITFDARTGALLSRPYQKFFNAGEREECLEARINLADEHVVLEKLDGSMIHAFIAPDGQLAFATRSGVTWHARSALQWFTGQDDSGSARAEVAALCRAGFTPIFEWLSPDSVVVVQHRAHSLVLTAIRTRLDGSYVPAAALPEHARRFGIPAIMAMDPIEAWASFAATARAERTGEGYVVRFTSGYMLKVKNELYSKIHALKALLTKEKDAFAIVLGNDLDDLLPHMTEAERAKVVDFREAVLRRVQDLARRIDMAVEAASKAIATDDPRERPKRFWLDHAQPLGSDLAGLAVQVWNGKAVAFDAVRDLIIKATTSGPRAESLAERLELPRWAFTFEADG